MLGSNNRTWIYGLVAVLITLIVFIPSTQNGWTNWDDPDYVLRNYYVQNFSPGIFAELWSPMPATNGYPPTMGNYHPITMVSLSMDKVFFGDSAAGFHWASLIIHLANVFLLFLIGMRLFKNPLGAGIAALLFGIHPMHVESVAWISGRKDLLMTLFYFAGLLAYIKYSQVEKGRSKWFLLILTCFLFALWSKAVAVTFPLVLFLIDIVRGRKFDRKVILEKFLLFWIALIFGLIAILAQSAGPAMTGNESRPFTEKIFAASYGFTVYLIKFVAPFKLSAFHPYPDDGEFHFGYVFFQLGFFVIAGLVLASLKKTNAILFGFGVFFITVLPVLQIVSVGDAVIAERYTYLPYFGVVLLIAYVWKFVEEKYSNGIKYGVLGALGIWIAMLSWMSFDRAKVWDNSETLWSDVIEKYPNAHISYINRSGYYVVNDKVDLALADLTKAGELAPEDGRIPHNKGVILQLDGRLEEALVEFKKAVALDSNNTLAIQEIQVIQNEMGKDTTSSYPDASQ